MKISQLLRGEWGVGMECLQKAETCLTVAVLEGREWWPGWNGDEGGGQ